MAAALWSGQAVFAADVTYTGISGGEWATGGNWSSSSYPGNSDIAVLDTTANLSIEAPNNIQGIRIGTNGTGRLQIGSYGTLTANSNPSVTSRIGDGSGNVGYVQQEDGIVAFNRLEIGVNSSNGTYHIHSGTLSLLLRDDNDNAHSDVSAPPSSYFLSPAYRWYQPPPYRPHLADTWLATRLSSTHML